MKAMQRVISSDFCLGLLRLSATSFAKGYRQELLEGTGRKPTGHEET